MKRKMLSLFLTLALFMGCLTVPASAAATGAERAAQTASNGQPYYIMINREMCTVTVYALDDKGYYSVPYKAMICSVGTPSLGTTPTGDFTLPGGRWTWKYMRGVYVQYATWIEGDYLMHSITYSADENHNSLITSSYNGLGAPASHGCIRLLTQDAKWIYENCGKGTKVTIYDSPDPGPLGKPAKAIGKVSGNYGWDPTDVSWQNPWAGKIATSIGISEEKMDLYQGTTYQLTVGFYPTGGAVAAGTWVSSNPSVVTVDNSGNLQGIGPGKATITCQFGSLTAHCVVNVLPVAGQTGSSSDGSADTPIPPVSSEPPVSYEPPAPSEPLVVQPTSYSANLSSSTTAVNGRLVSMPTYTLKGADWDTSYYVRLRDLGAALCGTTSQFAVGTANGMEAITPYSFYFSDGTEGFSLFSNDSPAIPAPVSVQIGGQQVTLNAISVAGWNGVTYQYYRLHELASILGFQTWLDGSGIVILRTL